MLLLFVFSFQEPLPKQKSTMSLSDSQLSPSILYSPKRARWDEDEDDLSIVEDKDDNESEEEYTCTPTYASKGRDHTIEHVQPLGTVSCLQLRKKHWEKCVLLQPSLGRAQACALGEVRDCLSTVWLATAEKNWGTENTEEQMALLRRGVHTQLMGMPTYWEDREDEEAELQTELQDNLEGNLKQVYNNLGYLSEAKRRLKAVNFIVDRMSKETSEALENDVFLN